jgi:hypothetical protein
VIRDPAGMLPDAGLTPPLEISFRCAICGMRRVLIPPTLPLAEIGFAMLPLPVDEAAVKAECRLDLGNEPTRWLDQPLIRLAHVLRNFHRFLRPPVFFHLRALSANVARRRVFGFFDFFRRRKVDSGILLPFFVPVVFRSLPRFFFLILIPLLRLRVAAITFFSCACAWL